MGIEIRPITADEFSGWSDSLDIGFSRPEKRDGGAFRRKLWGDEIAAGRVVGALDGANVVGTLGSFATELTVPGGGALSVGAVTVVSVQPTHRRRGILTGMIAEHFRQSAELGEAASILIPAEYPIYGRFGYGPATELAYLQVDATEARLARPLPGTVEYISAEDWASEMPAVYERVRATSVGAIQRREWWWSMNAGLLRPEDKPEEKGTLFAVCRDDDGTARGYAAYKFKDDDSWQGFRPRMKAEVLGLLAETPQVRARLLQFLWEHDWVAEVVVESQPVDDFWKLLLHNPRVVEQSDRHDFVWVRVLDVAAALSQRTYEGEGRLVVAVSDPDGYAEGVYALEGGPSGATCTRTTESPDLTMPVQTLGSLYLGGYSATGQASIGNVVEERSGTLAVADRMFKTAIAPFAPTWF